MLKDCRIILLFLTFSLLMHCFTASAAHNAMVTATKATVYSDMAMESPIGFLKSGTTIRVGEEPKNSNQVLPFFLNGKVAYIKISDITSKINVEQVEKRMEIFQKVIPDMSQASFSIHKRKMGGAWTKLCQDANDNESMMTMFGAGIFLRPGKVRFYLQSELSYGLLSQESLKFSIMEFSTTLFYPIIRVFNLISIDGYIGGHVVPLSSMRIRTSVNTYGSAGYGGKFGLNGSIFPTAKIGFFGGIGYYKTAFDGYKELPVPYGTISGSLPSIGSGELYIGAFYRL